MDRYELLTFIHIGAAIIWVGGAATTQFFALRALAARCVRPHAAPARGAGRRPRASARADRRAVGRRDRHRRGDRSRLIALVDLRGALIATGLILPVFALATRGARRSIDEEVRVPDESIELLRRIPLFSPLPPAAMERLAASLDALRYEEGSEIIIQGTPGERFYVLTDGTVEVECDGRSVGTFGPGYFFGEIALLRDVPRTATVRALTSVEVQALDRDEFLAAVTGHAPSTAAAEDVVSARRSGLGRLALRRV